MEAEKIWGIDEDEYFYSLKWERKISLEYKEAILRHRQVKSLYSN